MKKTLFPLLISLVVASACCQAQSWTEDYNRLLGKYVTPSGVKYAAWKANAEDVAALGKVTAAIAKSGPGGDRNAKLTYYINAYNANILAGVLEKYPLKSIRDIAPLFGFFTKSSITVNGEKMSFNHLEKDIVRPMKEPRVHFALNCASASCPPLRPKAYTAAKLDSELDQVTAPFVNSNPKGVRVSDGGKKADISMIFDWYKEDFQPAGGPVAFINKYRPKSPLAADAKISYQEYDWSLNAAK
jgi:hypothetical protein